MPHSILSFLLFSLKGGICTSVQRWAILKLPLLALLLLSYLGLANPTFLRADVPTATVLTSSLNPSFTGNSVTITATVTSSGNPVTTGTVSFFEGAQALATNVSLNGSGQATFSKSNWTEGGHLVTVHYNGTAGFNSSSGSLIQTVNTATTVDGTTFCNEGGITINDNGMATPYPSRINVSGLTGTIEKVTITLKNLTHTAPDDIDLLLYSPTGQKYVFMSDVGGANAVTNLDLIFDSSASSELPNNTTLVSGTFRPTDFEVGTDAFPSPAPAGPYTSASTTSLGTLFINSNPNGTWYLYAVDDAVTNTGSIGGWCLNFTMNCTPPNITAPTVTQPTCAVPTGTIVVNATGTGTIEYSINNGDTWSTNATFNNLDAGNYNIKARIQGSPSCETTYASNPVVLSSPFTVTTTDTWTGCVSTDWATAGNWQDGSVPTATDDVNIPNVTNDPVIGAGTAAVAKSVLVLGGAVLTINATGSLAINGAVSPRHGLDNYGTLDNNGTIRVGNTSAVGAIGIVHRNGGTFNNKPNAAIYIDQAGGAQAFYSNGLVNNEALIKIGSNAAVTGGGIRLEGNTFNNKTGGAIYIDWTGSHAIYLLNTGTVMNNEALIDIGSQKDIRGVGLRSATGCTFTNKVGGEIRINRIGILNTSAIGAIRNEGTFTNDAVITVGNIGLVRAQDGILNTGSSSTNFTNSATGIISIANPWGNGIWNSSGTFQNAGKITISNVFNASEGSFSTGILSTTAFTNTTGAKIYIDQVQSGIVSTRAFTNAGLIQMGENGSLTGSGIANVQGVNAVFNNAGGEISIKQTAIDGVQNEAGSIFNNNACAKLTIFDNLNNAGTFTNAGLFTVNTVQTHTNSALTNDGVIEYPQGNSVPNVTNNDMIVAPMSVCGTIGTSALQIGGTNNFTAGSTWYSDALLTIQAGTYDQASNTFTLTNVALSGTQTMYFSVNDASNPCPKTVSIQVTMKALPTAAITGGGVACKDGASPTVVFTGNGGVTPYKFTYKINDGAPQTVTTTSGNSVTVSAPTGVVGTSVYTLLSVEESSSTTCSQSQLGSVEVKIQGKPTITLTTLQQTLNEGNSQVLCDTDANPVNGLQFTVSGLCVSGSPVWRVQVGSGSWSDWSPNAPVSQSSNNQLHRYQAACDGSCPVTYTSPIELTINYRSTVPQNVSLFVDGVTVAVGETKEVCSLVNIPLSFNANCGVNEVTLYSVDGGEYSAGVPVGLVDNQFHNYRVRCRQSGGTVSCVESESGVMRLKLVVIPSAPTVSLSSTSSCNPSASFSGQSSCGSLRTVWYNATTNVALPSLPATVPSQTTSYYARCQTENGCVSEKSNVVTFTLTPTQVAPIITVSQEIVCTGTTVTISANCPAGSQTFWNTGVTTSSFEVSFSNVTKQSYWAKCLFEGGCQSAESVRKDIYWNAFVVTLINIGESKSAVKPVNDKSLWSSQFITRDGGPELEQSTQVNPTLYFVENANKMAPRYWTINVEACGLSTDGSLTFDMLATPEMGVLRSFNTHENNAPYFMYANREGWTELYAQNHPAYGFYQDNGAGGNFYDAGLPKGLYKLGIRYWDQKGWGSIYPSTRKPQGNVLAYQEYWFRIQSKDGVGLGAARQVATGSGQVAKGKGQAADNGKQITDNVSFATVLPNPVTNILRLKVQDSKGQVVQAALMDAAGREVLSRQFVPETNTHQEEFSVSALPTGMYFLKVTTSDQQVTLKVVKVE
ncbi:Ig-like domain repeat protein [Runella sp. SP2]|uniref:Ig-like domain repeat protein n=1 Tax=Runella sp. SP2 TaxID=2268026 RepID=UPI0013DD9082|nr:Ig-like domain repeat protein [Runella sp. SP2]